MRQEPLAANNIKALQDSGSIPFLALLLVLIGLAGCRTPGVHRVETDTRATAIIAEKQEQAIGQATPFTLDRPSDRLRRRLLLGADLPRTGPASLGTDQLPRIEHWPEADAPARVNAPGLPGAGKNNTLPLILTLVQALEIGAANSSDYQEKKENVFQNALALDLERNQFRSILASQAQGLADRDGSSDPTVSGLLGSADISLDRTFKNGVELTTALAADLATLLSAGGTSAFGITADATLSIPLLRGSGRHIVTEPLLQAERNVVYAIWEFERFKKEFAVNVGTSYLAILQQMDTVKNNEEDYRSRIISARRSRRLADAGRIKEIEVDQSVQNELSARQRWISSREYSKKLLDSFKTLLGLPPDAPVKLDPGELERIHLPPLAIVSNEEGDSKNIRIPAEALSADAPVLMIEPGAGTPGPLELDRRKAICLALANRLDMRVAQENVNDAQRAVVVAADALGAELTILGSASIGERRTITTADLDNARLRTDKGIFSALVTLDLPFERTAEAVAYRNSFIELEQAVRTVQTLEDTIKLTVSNKLSDLLEARESLYIQTKAVAVATKRVKSTTLFMEAGRAETRDLLEAQDALLSAQNGLTSARINYRVAELELQRDTGLLTVTETGLWQEYSPETPLK